MKIPIVAETPNDVDQAPTLEVLEHFFDLYFQYIDFPQGGQYDVVHGALPENGGKDVGRLTRYGVDVLAAYIGQYQAKPISQDSAISVKSFLESISLADTPYNDYESDRLDLIETLEMLIRVRPQWETQARLEREKLARLVIKKYEGTFAVPFEDCEMLDLALQIVGDKPADHGNDFAEGLDKRINETIRDDREAFDKAHASLKCQLFSEDTLHVEVPEAVNTQAFNDAVSGFCDATGYYDLDESGLLIDAADLEGMIESEAEDRAIADFLIQVRLVVQDADYIYFHRNLRCRPNTGGKKQNHGELLADGTCRDCGVVPPPKQL